MRIAEADCSYCGVSVVIAMNHARIDPNSLNISIVEERIREFRSALKLNPNDEITHYGLGIAYFNLGLLDEASDELAQAARLMPENPNIQTQLAVVYSELTRPSRSQNLSKAWDRIDRALRLRPDFEDALLLKASLHLRTKQWVKAVETWRVIAKSNEEVANSQVQKFVWQHLDSHPHSRRSKIQVRREQSEYMFQWRIFALLTFLAILLSTLAVSFLSVSAAMVLIVVAICVGPMCFRHGKIRLKRIAEKNNLDHTKRFVSRIEHLDTSSLIEEAEIIAWVLSDH